MIKFIKVFVLILILIIAGFFIYKIILRHLNEKKVLNQIINRLEADSRVAEVLVTGVNYDEKTQKTFTTIKFLEYDSSNNPMMPKYFTFSGNVIQFQSLVIRFEDDFIRKHDKLKGKSVNLFWKVFMLDGNNTQEFDITEINSVPLGYKIELDIASFETTFWEEFWSYAFDQEKAKKAGIKNVQIEAPGSMFVPGMIYKVKIEHDGGLRIDSYPISPILKGERIL